MHAEESRIVAEPGERASVCNIAHNRRLVSRYAPFVSFFSVLANDCTNCCNVTILLQGFQVLGREAGHGHTEHSLHRTLFAFSRGV